MSAPTTPQHTATQAPETPAQAAPGFAVPNVNDPSKKPTPPRDWVYFRETGDCLLCVGGVLFKVHRYLLTKESPVFQKKLAAADGAKAAKGQPNADTIILDDDVDLFRDLCWVLYASLDELWQLTSAPISGSPLSRMKKLLRIAEISHKYEITGTRTWAVHGVADLYEKYEQAEMKKPDADLSFIFAEPTTDLLKCFTIAAEISQRKDMFERAKQIWLSDIEKGRAIAHEALAMAQEKGWRQFQGRIYLAILRGLAKSNYPTPFVLFGGEKSTPSVCRILDARKDAPKVNLPFGPNSPVALALSSDQMTRLLKGNLVLTQLQREFAGVDGCHIPLGASTPFSRSLETVVWEDFWKACVSNTTRQQQTGLIHNDLLAMITAIQELMEEVAKGKQSLDSFSKLREYAGLTSNIHNAVTLLKSLREKFLENLPDYFFVP